MPDSNFLGDHEMDDGADTIVLRSSNERTIADDRPPENPFSCNVCKKSYKRIDHLARHYRSHSRERPFLCDTCGKTFARIDLLKRHSANHEIVERSPADGPPAAKRRVTLPELHRLRALRACQTCADAKARCEGDRPCLRCQQKSILCEYPPSRANEDLGQHESHQPSVPHTIGHDYNDAGFVTEPERAVEAPAADQMTDQRRSSNINPNVSTEFQASDFHLPTSSMFNAADTLSSSGPYDAQLMDTLGKGPAFEFQSDQQHSNATQSGLIQDFFNDDTFPRDVLDFGVDLTFSTPSVFNAEFLMPFGQQPLPFALEDKDFDSEALRSGFVTPGLRSKFNINASTQAFKESLWFWTPAKEDHGGRDQHNLSLPWNSVTTDEQELNEPPPNCERINNTIRGQVLAMVLRTCEPAMYPHVVSNFPGTDLLTRLIHNFINFHARTDLPWIHLATVELSKESPEFLGGMVAYGAAISTEPELRKLGFAIQEAVRMANPQEFERDNRLTRSLRPLQAYALVLDVGLWSGDRRKMEISESFALPLVTMVRRAGHFRGAKAVDSLPTRDDTGPTLEVKWRSWAQQESFRRLAMYLFYRDARSSMSVLSPPLISYAEFTTALPCRKEMWEAKSADSWKTAYLAHPQEEDKASQARTSLLDDSTHIYSRQQVIDSDISVLLMIAAVWQQLWQYREMVTAAKFSGKQGARHDGLVMNSRRLELTQRLDHIRMNAQEWDVKMNPAACLFLEQCLMHLYVSLEDVQLLAGKEGEEEARRILPSLTAWAESSDARQAVFHAGQVFRAAKKHQKFMLRNASAVAVYHAGLVFWAYAVLLKTDSATLNDASPPATKQSMDFVRVDRPEGPELKRFLMLGRGVPCIEASPSNDTGTQTVQEVPLSEPAEVMETITRVLQKQHEGGKGSVPPLLENLSNLMHSLGNATVGRGAR